jgi:hypothetical protein
MEGVSAKNTYIFLNCDESNRMRCFKCFVAIFSISIEVSKMKYARPPTSSPQRCEMRDACADLVPEEQLARLRLQRECVKKGISFFPRFPSKTASSDRVVLPMIQHQISFTSSNCSRQVPTSKLFFHDLNLTSQLDSTHSITTNHACYLCDTPVPAPPYIRYVPVLSML